MVEIEIISANAFTLNGETLQRQYTTYLNRAGDVIMKHLKYRFSLNLGDVSNITVDGNPATLETILKTGYNFSCGCGGEYTPVEDFKIFDATFNNTFE